MPFTSSSTILIDFYSLFLSIFLTQHLTLFPSLAKYFYIFPIFSLTFSVTQSLFLYLSLYLFLYFSKSFIKVDSKCHAMPYHSIPIILIFSDMILSYAISPNVAVDKDCVSPLVKREDPWAPGRREVSMEIGRTSSTPLPSLLFPVLIMILRNLRTSNFFLAIFTSIGS